LPTDYRTDPTASEGYRDRPEDLQPYLEAARTISNLERLEAEWMLHDALTAISTCI